MKKFISIFLLFMLIPNMFAWSLPWSEPTKEILVTEDYSHGNAAKEFISVTGSSSNLLTFVDIGVEQVISNNKLLRSAGIYYYPGNNKNVETGFYCARNEMAVFTYCDNKDSKSSCKNKMFDQGWQVKSSSDYLNLADFYTGDTDGFYYTYSCYEMFANYEETEKQYLYKGACVTYRDADNGKGSNYITEKKCIEALKKQQESSNSCDYKLLDEKTCIGDRIYQLERQKDCSEEFTKRLEFCYDGCSQNKCNDKPAQSCNFKPKGYVCKGDALFQEVRTEACMDELDFVKSCDYGCNNGACMSEKQQEKEQENEQSTSEEQTNQEETSSDDEFCLINCEPEELEKTEVITCNLCNNGAIERKQFQVDIGETCASKQMFEITDFNYVQACNNNQVEETETPTEPIEEELGFFASIWEWFKNLFGGSDK